MYIEVDTCSKIILYVIIILQASSLKNGKTRIIEVNDDQIMRSL